MASRGRGKARDGDSIDGRRRVGFARDEIAIVYDFDGTLSPQPMQEYTVLPELGIEPAAFWSAVDREVAASECEGMLVYMRHLVEEAARRGVRLGRADLRALGRRVRYFPGVPGWFARTDAWVRERGRGRVRIGHYVVSAGLREILDGVSIRPAFRRVYASEYHFDRRGVATFPKVLITDTTKTQYLFRINKGRLDLRQSINTHMPEGERPIPFSNIVYIGDGLTDVPSMAVTRQAGGHALAVWNRDRPGAREGCEALLAASRVDFIAPADYRAGSTLERRVRLLLDAVIADIRYRRELHACRLAHRM
ncbi:MAG: haloacid dehalogenase-like hydrolase [Ectothiorhodospiraceae bacterium]|nr:haloacid dehalogenase-like hydrolase [Chromatiales bacterium]MCP5154367.1 haloacid dehalogenase-like hydrolase [Ectothiorhodospiraceae bacterium]